MLENFAAIKFCRPLSCLIRLNWKKKNNKFPVGIFQENFFPLKLAAELRRDFPWIFEFILEQEDYPIYCKFHKRSHKDW